MPAEYEDVIDDERDTLTGLVGSDGARQRIVEWQRRAVLEGETARILRFAADELEGEWLVSRMSGGNFLLAAYEPCSRERWQWLAENLADSVSRPIANPGGAGTMRLWPRIAL